MDRRFDYKKLINMINWDQKTSTLMVDIQGLFYMVFRHRKEMSEEDMIDLWKKVAAGNCPVAYMTMRDLMVDGLIEDSGPIEKIITDTINLQAFGRDEKLTSQHLAAAAMLGIRSPALDRRMASFKKYTRIRICSRALEYIELTSSIEEQGKAVLNFIRYIYSSKYMLTSAIRETIRGPHGGGYHFPVLDGVREPLNDLINELLRDGAFDLAQNVKNIFDYEYSMAGIGREDMLAILRKSDSSEYFRGCLIYRDITEANADIASLKKWYEDICSIETETAKQNRRDLRLLYMLYALELKPETPEEALKYIGVEYWDEDIRTDFIKSHIEEHYRKACYMILMAGRGDFLIDFVRQTEFTNADIYYRMAQKSDKAGEHIGDYNIDDILENLMQCSDEMHDVIYLYFNTFLRSVVRFSPFLYRLKERYHLSISELAKAFRGYTLECTFNFHEGRKNMTDETKIAVIPLAVKSKDTDIIAIPKVQRELLREIGYDDDHTMYPFTTRIEYVNPSEYSVVMFLGVSWEEDQDRVLSLLRESMSSYRNGEIDNKEISKVFGSVNVNMLNKNSSFVDMCIDMLKMFIDIVAIDTRKCRTVINLVRPNNYYNYHKNSRSTFAKNLNCISADQEKEIRSCWERLSELDRNSSDADANKMLVETSYHIFRNSLLRRFYTLEDFLTTFIDEKDRRHFFRSFDERLMTGKVLSHYTDNGKNVVEIEPVAFITGDNRFIAYPRVKAGIDGFPAGSFVTFEIASYEGNGIFVIDRLKAVE